jgi:SAM-dependent methyltransferase
MKRYIDGHGKVCYSIRSGGKLYTYREDSLVFPSDVWTDIEHLHQRDPERTGYATQKPEALLQRILFASSREGDLVADLFSGSGTTAAVASKTGRRFLACDSSPYALYAIRRRLCEEHNALNLFKNSQQLELRFAASAPNVCVDASLHANDGVWNCEVATFSSNTNSAPVSCALGVIENDLFIPGAYAFAPSLPLTLHMPDMDGAPALQIMDTDGQQGFWLF